MSCKTKTCPSTSFPAPIPIIGILTDFAISLANSDGTFSITIAKQPVSSKSLASANNLAASSSSFALTV